MSLPLRLFIIAGEPSGDKLGAALIEGLKEETGGAVEILGVGGPLMTAAGLQSLFPMDELSVMGVAEVLPRLPNLLRRIRQTGDAVIAAQPAALITIDSPDFCLRVARRARKAAPDLRTIHYVAPSVWAWRPGRAAKMARIIDHVLTLLPFEPPYMTAAGMTADFVGHPVAAEPQATHAEIVALREGLAIRDDQRILLVLPGSRGSEVGLLAPVFCKVSEQIVATHPDVRVVIPTVEHMAQRVTDAFAGSSVRPEILNPALLPPDLAARRKRAAFAAADLALAASGTVSLELAAADTPMVIAYDAKPLTRFIAERLVKIDTATLVNLLTETRTVPEFIGRHCSAENITPAVEALLNDPQAMARQKEAGRQAMVLLGRGGDAPGVRAARSVLSAIG